MVLYFLVLSNPSFDKEPVERPGDPLGALNRVALRDDPPALALRGIAMAQLGDFERAKVLLRQAARAFGPKQILSRAVSHGNRP